MTFNLKECWPALSISAGKAQVSLRAKRLNRDEVAEIYSAIKHVSHLSTFVNSNLQIGLWVRATCHCKSAGQNKYMHWYAAFSDWYIGQVETSQSLCAKANANEQEPQIFHNHMHKHQIWYLFEMGLTCKWKFCYGRRKPVSFYLGNFGGGGLNNSYPVSYLVLSEIHSSLIS